jgi:hypothetical protein
LHRWDFIFGPARPAKTTAKKSNHIIRQLTDYRTLLQENPEQLDAPVLLAKHRELVLAYLEKELRSLGWRLRMLVERLQRLRCGEQIPAPLTMEVAAK